MGTVEYRFKEERDMKQDKRVESRENGGKIEGEKRGMKLEKERRRKEIEKIIFTQAF